MHLTTPVRTKLLVLAWGCLWLVSLHASARDWKDTAGKFRTEAEFVAVRNGKVILEKADGEIITFPLEKLSAADQAYVRSQTGEKTAPTPAKPAADADAGVGGKALAQRVQAVFQTNCYRCHGQDGASEGGFNYVLNLKKLARTYVMPKTPDESPLFERLSATDESAMPPPGELLRPTPADIAIVKAWIEAGAPSIPVAKPREFVSNNQIMKYILADVRKAPERSRRFLRYFTLTHLYNAGVSDDELRTYRNAFVKLINSLSWNTNLLVPETIDPAGTVWRIDIRQVNWSNQVWEEIEQANPYFLAMSTPDALACNESTQSTMPCVRVDWFVFAASKPPLYHSILGVPSTDRELEEILKVNAEANIDQEQAIRAAFNRSGVSQNNRLIERHKSPFGSYWKSYDFGGNTGRQNLFEHPLGPGDDDEAFKHAGGELIFTLPNGLQGYMLANDRGQRIDKGPIDIVSDPNRPDRSVTNGVSCMSCHYTGVIPKTDEIGSFVKANRKAFENANDILALYREPKDLNDVLEEDAKRFAQAMQKLGVTSLSRSGEPISTMAARFEQELDLQMVALEFGLTPPEFETRLLASDSMARSFGALRVPGGTIKRDVFVALFGRAAVEFRLVKESQLEVSSLSGNSSTGKAPLSRTDAGRAASAKTFPGGSFSSGSSKSAGRTSKQPSRVVDQGRVGEVQRFGDIRWAIRSLAFSPDGGSLAAGKMDRALLLFDVAKGQRLDAVDKLQNLGQITECRFTPDGSKLLTGGYSGQILIWDVSKDGRLQQAGQFVGHSKEILCIAVSSDGRFAVSGGGDNTLRYWQISNGKELGSIPGFQGAVKACQLSADGKLALATDGAALRQIDLQKGQGQIVKQIVLGRSPARQMAAISQDGTLLAAGESSSVRLWDITTGNELPKLEDNEIQWSGAFTPDGTRLITGGAGKLNVWDVRKRRKIHSQSMAGTYYVQCLAMSPDNKHVAAIPGSAGQVLQVFRIPLAEK